nr:CRISPR-associated helicase Cas3' [Heliomicrobium modesticaldum]
MRTAFLAAMHDIGKCHAQFQVKGIGLPVVQDWIERELLPHASRVDIRHEAYTRLWLEQWLRSKGWGRFSSGTVGLALQGHHGSFVVPCKRVDDGSASINELWKQLRLQVVEELLRFFQMDIWKQQDFPDHSTFGMLLSGITVLADWIASSEAFFGGDIPDWHQAKQKNFEVLALQFLDQVGLSGKKPINAEMTEEDSFLRFWRHLHLPSLRPLQALCEQIARSEKTGGLAIIEAPMGEGKSEAGIYLLNCWVAGSGGDGMYVALPTAATANQMYSRVQELLSNQGTEKGLRLVHGMAWLLDLQKQYWEEDEREDWFRPKKRALLAPYGVGTVDQAMLAAMRVKFGCLRLLGLAGKGLLIDEVHAYDTYMNTIIDQLLAWCGHLSIPVVLLSATLPVKRRKQLLEAYGGDVIEGAVNQQYPLVTVAVDAKTCEFPVLPSRPNQEYNLRMLPGALENAEAIVNAVLDWADAHDSGCAGVVVNTVYMAQQVFRKLKKLHRKGRLPSDVELLLYHARFTAGRRKAIEDKVLRWLDKGSLQDPARRPKRAVLVATQVVEQSLDIDFDVLFTELAPIDLLLQRIGRLWRHERPRRLNHAESKANVSIFAPEIAERFYWGKTGAVYEPLVLLKTLAVLQKRNQFQLPQDFRPLIESVYDDEIANVPDEWLYSLASVREEYRKNQVEQQQRARESLYPKPLKSELAVTPIFAVNEEVSEGEVSSHLHAVTRIGSETRSVLAVPKDEWERVGQGLVSHEQLHHWMKYHVSLPEKWLSGCELPALKPYRQWSVMPMHPGSPSFWEGTSKGGNVIRIEYDDELGFRLGKEEPNATSL